MPLEPGAGTATAGLAASSVDGVVFREFAAGSAEHAAALRLRDAVLRKPLQLEFTAEELAEEPACFHLGAFHGERLVAVLLLKPVGPNEVKMRQVAVDPEYQFRGIGSGLVAFAERHASERGCRRIWAHARASAAEFYRKAGYTVSEKSFLENTIPHRLAARPLS
jgi:ribosomal protein S18 acetylase RimI-like enzyme